MHFPHGAGPIVLGGLGLVVLYEAFFAKKAQAATPPPHGMPAPGPTPPPVVQPTQPATPPNPFGSFNPPPDMPPATPEQIAAAQQSFQDALNSEGFTPGGNFGEQESAPYVGTSGLANPFARSSPAPRRAPFATFNPFARVA